MKALEEKTKRSGVVEDLGSQELMATWREGRAALLLKAACVTRLGSLGAGNPSEREREPDTEAFKCP